MADCWLSLRQANVHSSVRRMAWLESMTTQKMQSFPYSKEMQVLLLEVFGLTTARELLFQRRAAKSRCLMANKSRLPFRHTPVRSQRSHCILLDLFLPRLEWTRATRSTIWRVSRSLPKYTLMQVC